jgi:hypothetical protein
MTSYISLDNPSHSEIFSLYAQIVKYAGYWHETESLQ